MPMRINGLWRVSWWRPNNGIVKVKFEMDGSPRIQPQYFFGNILRDYGEPKINEMYRLRLDPSFPHEVTDS